MGALNVPAATQVGATVRRRRNCSSLPTALREAEEMLKQFTSLYPNEAILRHLIRGCAAYELEWFDATAGPTPNTTAYLK